MQDIEPALKANVDSLEHKSFDPAWYLSNYPDVAAAGLDPWFHYCRFGRSEGRLPRADSVPAFEYWLWRGADEVVLPRLAQKLLDAGSYPQEVVSARWHAHQRNWRAVLETLCPGGVVIESDFVGVPLLALEAFTHLLASKPSPSGTSIDQILVTLRNGFPEHSDTALAMANAVFSFGRLSNGRLDHADLPLNFARFQELMGVESSVLVDDSVGHLSNAPILDSDELRLKLINSVFAKAQLFAVSRRVADQQLTIDNLVPAVSDKSLLGLLPKNLFSSVRPLVSVIVPMHNAGQSIKTALLGLFEQTWRPLEIIVVDDGSTDDCVAVVSKLREQCPDGVSLSLVLSDTNLGAFVARNLGLLKSTGEFVTVHDSDDWSHPQKLEKQVLYLLKNPSLMGCFSHWVRANKDLVFTHWRIEPEGWTYRNMSSLMCRRSVFDALGSWDEVRVNGDTEFHERLVKVFGKESVTDVLPGVPLSFGRISADSLSQASATHLITQYRGVRHDYMASARRWHAAFAKELIDNGSADGVRAESNGSLISKGRVRVRGRIRHNESAKGAAVVAAGSGSSMHSGMHLGMRSGLYLPPRPGYRPFPAPAIMCSQDLEVRFVHPLDEIQASGLFDAAWYVRNYLDLQKHIIDPLQHYWDVGAAEGRDPGPNFSTSGYLAANSEIPAGENPLLHFVRLASVTIEPSDGEVQAKRQGGSQTNQLGARDRSKERTVAESQGWVKKANAGTVLREIVLQALPTSLMREALPGFNGEVQRKRLMPTVMLVGHASGDMLYGAERSLVDVARAISELGFNLVVVLPTAVNSSYIQTLRVFALAVVIIPFGWWQRGKIPENATIQHFSRVIDDYRVDLVHVNTLVLDEPLVAARQKGIPSLIHIRELLKHDVALRDDLNVTAAQMRRRLLSVADGLIANSSLVLEWLRESTTEPFLDTNGIGIKIQSETIDDVSNRERSSRVVETNGLDDSDGLGLVTDFGNKKAKGEFLFHVTNTVDMSRLLTLPIRRKQASSQHKAGNLIVGMISSNHPKKGLEDVVEIAKCLDAANADVSLVLFGPETPDLRRLLDQQARTAQSVGAGKGGEGANELHIGIGRISYGGYVADPADALAKVDAVINVSRFQESFGRTALEAMAAAKPVIGYRWGALPELVLDGETGFLLPFGDAQAVADCLIRLSHNLALRIRFGHAGRRRAVSLYSQARLNEQLLKAYTAFDFTTNPLPSR